MNSLEFDIFSGALISSLRIALDKNDNIIQVEKIIRSENCTCGAKLAPLYWKLPRLTHTLEIYGKPSHEGRGIKFADLHGVYFLLMRLGHGGILCQQ